MHAIAVQCRNGNQGLDKNRSEEEEDDIDRRNQIHSEDDFATLTRNPCGIHKLWDEW